MSDSLTRLFHITEARDGASSTVLEGTDQLVPGVRVDPAAFAGTPALVAAVIDGRLQRYNVTCVRLTITPADVGQRIVLEVSPRVPPGVVGGTTWVEERLVPPAPPPASTVIAIDAGAAAARGLPPIGLRLDRAGAAGMTVSVFPDPRTFVRASGPPGAPLLFSIHPSQESAGDAAAVERAMRDVLRDEGEIEIVERSQLPIAGAARDVVVIVTNRWQEVTWLGALVVAKSGTLLVLAGATFGPGRRVGAAHVAAVPALAPLLSSLVVDGVQPPAGPSTLATRMAFESGDGATSADTRPKAPTLVKIDGWERTLLERAALRRALGSLLGLAVGDALGTTNEFKVLTAPPFPELAPGPLDDVVGGGPFKLAAGEVTDDTQMAAALAELFWKSPRISNGVLAVRYLEWRSVAFDVGVQINQALDLVARGTAPELAGRRVWEDRNRFPAGNGSLMRTAVIGTLLAAMPEQRRAAAFLDSAITHFDPRCQLACAAFDAAIAHALTERPSPASMLRAAADELRTAATAMRSYYDDLASEIDAAEGALAADLAAARDDDPALYGDELHLHKGAGFVRVAFRLAFWELMHAPDFRAGVIDAANRGGDADTNAAIVGALLGAFHGIEAIPASWIDRVLTARPLVADDHELHPRTLLRALARGFGAGDGPTFDHRSVAQLAPFVARAFPELPVEAAPSTNVPATIGGLRVERWLRGTSDFGQARVVDTTGRTCIATVLGDQPPIVEPEPEGVPLSTAMLPLRGEPALQLLVQLLETLRAASAAGQPIGHVSPELVYIAGDAGALRVTGILHRGDAAAVAANRARRFEWIPRAMWCAAPELLAGTVPDVPPPLLSTFAMLSGVYSACAVYLFACNRNDSRSLSPILDKAIADVVTAALQADPRMRPPIQVISSVIAAARSR